MLKIENLNTEDGKITMRVYVENHREDFFTLQLDAGTGEIVDCTREDMPVYPEQAMLYIQGLLQSGKSLPEEAIVTGY